MSALRIGYGRIFHEACADSPVRTTQADFLRVHHLEGPALAEACTLRGTELKSFFPHAELTGFVQAARLEGEVEAVPLSSSMAIPGGPLTRECFEWLVSSLLSRLRAAGPLDGIYLALHGSMEVEGLGEPPEANILRRVRELVGPRPKIAASFDLHGNMAPEIVERLELLVAYRSNPHWDLAPTGYRAGKQLIAALRGETRPTHAWRKLPVVMGGGMNIDFLEPMRPIFRFMKELERRPRVLTTSFFMVHPLTSATDLGWSVYVATDGDQALAEQLADELAERVWEVRRVPLPPMLDVEEALDRVERSSWRFLGPVSLVDTDDIVGAGAPGGNTHILRGLLEKDRGLEALVPLHDPEAFRAAWTAREGETIELVLRGTPGYVQPSIAVRAVVAAKADTELGRRVRLDVGKVRIAVAENPPLPIHPKFWRELGVKPRKADLMVQKNFFHYRIFHLLLSFEHLPVISSGATSLRRAAARALEVPSYPAVDVPDWRGADRVLRGIEGPTARAS